MDYIDFFVKSHKNSNNRMWKFPSTNTYNNTKVSQQHQQLKIVLFP